MESPGNKKSLPARLQLGKFGSVDGPLLSNVASPNLWCNSRSDTYDMGIYQQLFLSFKAKFLRTKAQ
jgi:hypothetical protein